MRLERGFFVKAETADKAEILIYEQIGESWFGGGISAKQFAEDLRALGDVKTLDIRINSPGGDVFEAVAMYNQLVQHSAVVNVFIDGLAASAASIVAMAGDTIAIATNAMMMIHDPWGVSIGNAGDMREFADLLDKIGSVLILTYEKRTKNPRTQIEEWMRAETWFTGQEAVDWGFADSLMAAKAVENSFDLSRFKNAPTQPTSPDLFHMEQDIRRRRLELVAKIA